MKEFRQRSHKNGEQKQLKSFVIVFSAQHFQLVFIAKQK